MGVKVREKVAASGVWWVFINHQGKRVSKKVGTEKAALKVAQEIEARITLGKEFLPKKKAPLPRLAEYYQNFRAACLLIATRKTTQEIYHTSFDCHILPELGSYRLDEITRFRIKHFIALLVEKGLARTTIRITMSQFSALLNHAIEDGLISQNPAARTAKFFKQAPVRHEEIQPLNASETRRFLREVQQSCPKYYPLFLCAIHTGLRSGELAGLRWGDLDFEGKFLVVRRSIVRGRVQPTKDDEIRWVDMSNDLVKVLGRLKRIRREGWLEKGQNSVPPWVFCNRVGNLADMQNVKNRYFFKCLERSGLRRIRFHDLRHSFATLLITNGESPAYVQKQLGHSSIKLTVDIYTHWFQGQNRQAVNKLPLIESASNFDQERDDTRQHESGLASVACSHN